MRPTAHTKQVFSQTLSLLILPAPSHLLLVHPIAAYRSPVPHGEVATVLTLLNSVRAQKQAIETNTSRSQDEPHATVLNSSTQNEDRAVGDTSKHLKPVQFLLHTQAAYSCSILPQRRNSNLILTYTQPYFN